MARKVKIVGVPGFTDDFRATVIPGLDRVAQPGEADVAVISTEAGETLVVPADSLVDIAPGFPVAGGGQIIETPWQLVHHGLTNGTTYSLALHVMRANELETIAELVTAILEGKIK